MKKWMRIALSLAVLLLCTACAAEDIVETALPTDDASILQRALDSIVLPAAVTENITWPQLQGEEYQNVSLSYESNNPAAITKDGTVTQVEIDRTAVITVTVKLGDLVKSKRITVKVLASGETLPNATDPTVTEPAGTEPAATEPAGTDPVVTEPAATKPSATDPSATEPSETDPSATEPVATNPLATEPSETAPPATEPPEIEPVPVGEQFYIDSTHGSITADTKKGMLTYAGSSSTQVYFKADEAYACAASWELSGTIIKNDRSSNLFLSFGVRDEIGQEQWFCLYESHVGISLQPTWNWADAVYLNDGNYVRYNKAASDFWAKNTDTLKFKLTIQNDVLSAWFGGADGSLTLAWTLPLTNSTFGGYAAGTGYQLAIYTVDPCVMTISNIRAAASGKVGFALEKLVMRDPFILQDNGTYYLYGTKGLGSFYAYSSTDLKTWYYRGSVFTGADDFYGNDFTNAEAAYWAPEVYQYNGAYYMIPTFTWAGTDHQQMCGILQAESPVGPFVPWSDGPITPSGHSYMDATLYIENGVPYLIYCHEWQCNCKSEDMGSMAYIQLSPDLKTTVGEPVEWFEAKEFTACTFLDKLMGIGDTFVTDGPFVYEAAGQKYLLWSTSYEGKYVQIATKFSYLGEEINVKSSSEILYGADGGHGMIFYASDGTPMLVLHTPNSGASHVELFYVEGGSDAVTIRRKEN